MNAAALGLTVFLALALCAPIKAAAQASPWLVNAIYSEPGLGQSFRSIVGLAKDPVSGELYVLDAGRHSIDILDPTGIPRFSFVHWVSDPKTKQRQPGEPNAIAISPRGDIFLTDFFSRGVDVLNIRGEAIDQIDVLTLTHRDDPAARPEKLGLDSQGWLYVSIAGPKGGVARCRPDGSECTLLIDAASEKIACITTMNVAPDGRVAITDFRGTPAVRVYDPGGKLQVGFAGHDAAIADLSYPAAFLFADDGTFWVADALRHAVKHYSATGEFLEYVGGYGAVPGGLRYPSSLAGNGVSDLYVAERVGDRVQEYVLPSALATPEIPVQGPSVSAGSAGAGAPGAAMAAKLQPQK